MPAVGKYSSTMEHLGLLSERWTRSSVHPKLVEHQMVRGSLRQVNWPASLALHKHSSCETLLQGLVCKKKGTCCVIKTRHIFCRKKPWSQFNHVHPQKANSLTWNLKKAPCFQGKKGANPTLWMFFWLQNLRFRGVFFSNITKTKGPARHPNMFWASVFHHNFNGSPANKGTFFTDIMPQKRVNQEHFMHIHFGDHTIDLISSHYFQLRDVFFSF